MDSTTALLVALAFAAGMLVKGYLVRRREKRVERERQVIKQGLETAAENLRQQFEFESTPGVDRPGERITKQGPK